jgi:queuosine biosynthesis protein QueD
MKMELRKSFQFEAAHLLPLLPKGHKCRRLHGHSFSVEVVVAGECDPKLGWLMDYADISAAFKPIWEKLDHYYLNEIPERYRSKVDVRLFSPGERIVFLPYTEEMYAKTQTWIHEHGLFDGQPPTVDYAASVAA